MDELKSVKKEFAYYKHLGEKAIEQVPDEMLNWKYNEESNSIAVIIKHLAGNMNSRWTDFLSDDGEKPWRNRDAEFENNIDSREELIGIWEKGWSCLFNTLNKLKKNDLKKTVYIRNQGHTVMEAILRQLAHYSFHIGQIVFIAKLICGKEWQTLSIPKGESAQFNDKAFEKPQRNEHFTDNILKDDDS